MAKSGIDHLFCKKHGIKALVIVEHAGQKHHFKTICQLCKGRYIAWCNIEQAQEIARRRPNIELRLLPETWAYIDGEQARLCEQARPTEPKHNLSNALKGATLAK